MEFDCTIAPKKPNASTAATAKNPAKKGFLPVEDRAKLIKEAVEEINLNNVTVDIAPNDLLTVDYAKANSASVLVRGLRTVTDFDSEMQLAEINKQIKEIKQKK